MKPIRLLVHEFVHSYRTQFCKWDLVIALEAGLRLELDFQAKNEFAGLWVVRVLTDECFHVPECCSGAIWFTRVLIIDDPIGKYLVCIKKLFMEVFI